MDTAVVAKTIGVTIHLFDARDLTNTLLQRIQILKLKPDLSKSTGKSPMYLLTRLKTHSTINALINPDGNIVHSDTLKVEIFNNFFTSVFTNENISSLPVFALDATVPALSDVDITPDIVLEKLRIMQPYKSPGPDGWPSKVIKECADIICTPLSKLYSKSLSNGSLPKDWKIAYIVPIFKKGNKQLASNYQSDFNHWQSNGVNRERCNYGTYVSV